MQQVASQAGTGALKDHLQRYVNSLGQATRLFEESGDPLSLDVIQDNCGAIQAIVVELQARAGRDSGYAPIPDMHLEELTREFLRRRMAESSGGAPVGSKPLVQGH
jgi:hypothetical protein